MRSSIFKPEELKYIKEKEFQDTYLRYIKIGLSIIPITFDGNPAIVDWEKYKYKRMEENEASKIFDLSIHGIGIITGEISNNLEVIIIDNEFHNLLIQGIFKYFGSKAESFATAIVSSEKTCFFYYCKNVEKGQIILDKFINGERKILIESKGSGEIVVAPTSIYNGWYAITGTNIKEITSNEKNKMFSIARKLIK